MLFSDHPPLAEGREQEWEAREDNVAQARTAAVAAILAERHLDGLLALVAQAERPPWVGITLGRTVLCAAEESTLLRDHLAAGALSQSEFARGLVLGRHERSGFAWAQEKLREGGQAWSPAQRGAFLAALPNTTATWDLVDASDDASQESYWRAMLPWGVRGEDAERLVRGLVRHGRPYSAIDVLAMNRGQGLSQALVAEALELAARTDPRTDVHMQSSSFHIGQLLNSLTPDSEVDVNRIARLEWAFLSLLRLDRSPKVLHDELSRNPQFFAEVVAFVFRAESEEPHEVASDEQQRALHGHELLRSWRTLPGRREAGQVDAEALTAWVREARQRTTEMRRGKVGDQMIGEMLSAAPTGADGAWPTEAVRDIVEAVASEDLEQGLEIGLYNSRGVVHKNPAAGGEQERQLAKRYVKYAETVRDRWPRTASLLRGIADTYRTQARREDDQAELTGRLDA